MEMTQEVWDRIAALEDRAAAAEKQIEALKADLDSAKIAVMQGQVKTALAKPTVVGPSMTVLLRRLDQHGIRIQPEDEDEAQGSGTERYGSGSAETWAESHDEQAAPV